jgi:V8-like Glu-specific endopeptidase
MIFETDDRTLVDYTNIDGRFVQIESTFSNGTTLQGSGVMVGPNDVLTAAHTFYSHENGGLATNVVVTPSSFNDYKPFGSVSADHFYLTEEWSLEKSFQYDYGVISLSSEIGYQTTWMNYGYINDLITTADTMMTSYGYAGDIEGGDWLISTSGQPDALNGNILLFREVYNLIVI